MKKVPLHIIYTWIFVIECIPNETLAILKVRRCWNDERTKTGVSTWCCNKERRIKKKLYEKHTKVNGMFHVNCSYGVPLLFSYWKFPRRQSNLNCSHRHLDLSGIKTKGNKKNSSIFSVCAFIYVDNGFFFICCTLCSHFVLSFTYLVCSFIARSLFACMDGAAIWCAIQEDADVISFPIKCAVIYYCNCCYTHTNTSDEKTPQHQHFIFHLNFTIPHCFGFMGVCFVL